MIKKIFKKNQQTGFTLMELLIAVAVIGVLSSGAFIGFEKIKASARDDTRISDLAIIKTAIHLYYLDNNSYPVPGFRITIGGNNSIHYRNFLSAMEPQYINPLPIDPLCPKEGPDGEKYCYVYRAKTGQDAYAVCAKMENKSGFACFDQKVNSSVFYLDNLSSLN